MRRVAMRTGGLGIAALLIMASSFGTVLFEAPAPGAELEPVNGAEQVIQLLQGRQSVLWTSLGGATVSAYKVLGWPSVDGDSVLGGALVITRPDQPDRGVIAFGERPMSLEFELDG